MSEQARKTNKWMTSFVARDRPARHDFVAVLRFAVPIVSIQVGLMFMGVVDTLMVGRLSAEALAAVALGNLYSFGLLLSGLGLLLALDPIIAQAVGARDELAAERGLQRGFVLAIGLSLPIVLAYSFAEPILSLLRQPAEVVPLAAGYVARLSTSVLPFLGFVVLRQTLQAHRLTRPIVVTIVSANLVNAVLNYVLIFGRLGFAPSGVYGAAWATVLSRWFMLAFLFALGWHCLGRYLSRVAPRLLAIDPMLKMVAVGLPIGGQVILEWSAFATIALLMGGLGVIEVAAHQIALNLASLTFMVPVGVASAAAVMVGHAIGRGDAAAARRLSAAALILGAAFMTLTAVIFIGLPVWLAGLYTRETAVVALAAALLPIAGLFQVFDGVHAVSLGILRGMGDTRVPVLVSIVGFWCLGLPTSIYLAFDVGLGPTGLWWGFVVGLGIAAVFLVFRVGLRLSAGVARLAID